MVCQRTHAQRTSRQTANTPQLEPLPASPAVAAARATKREPTSLRIDSANGWADTRIDVLAGDTLTFTAEGTLTFADGHTVTAAGAPRNWRDMLRAFPVDTADAGTLVGRIGTSEAAVPFTIGVASTITVRQSGTLFVRANISPQAPGTGTFSLSVRVVPAGATPVAVTNNALQSIPLPALDALPRRVSDAEGTPGDAVNFALVGTEDDLRSAFTQSGWFAVDPDRGSAVLHGLLSTLQHKPYLELPMSTLYLFGRPQDLSFARASALSVARDRHHLRCWKTTLLLQGRPVWIGAATHDIGIENDERNGNLTHRIAPRIDEERDFLRDSFAATASFQAGAYFTPGTPVHEAHTATGGSFQTDGRVLLLLLGPAPGKP